MAEESKKYLNLELSRYFGEKILEAVKENFLRYGQGVTSVEASEEDGAFNVFKAGKAQDGSGDILSTVIVPGVVTRPSYDASTRTIRLPISGGETLVISLGKDLVIDAEANNRYNPVTKKIELYLNDGIEADPEQGIEGKDPTKIEIPVGDLVDIYNISDSDTVEGSISLNELTGEKDISLEVKISDKAGNILQVIEPVEADPEQGIEAVSGGLYVNVEGVDLTDYVKKEELETTLEDYATKTDLEDCVKYTDLATEGEIDEAIMDITAGTLGADVGVSVALVASDDLATNDAQVTYVSTEGDNAIVFVNPDNLVAFSNADLGSGTHKWVALSIDTGVSDIRKVKFNNVLFTDEDVIKATEYGCSSGSFVHFLKVDEVINANEEFTLSGDSYLTKTITIGVVNPDED